MKKISSDALATEITKALREFAATEFETTKEVIKEVGKEAAERLKQTSPKRSGRYRKSWKSRVQMRSNTRVESTVYNAKHYRLTHLLEHGHALRKGGRTYGEVKPKVHIKPVEDWASDQVQKRLLKKL